MKFSSHKIYHHYGKSLYAASLFFPKNVRVACHALYSFIKIADHAIAPFQNDLQKASEVLDLWKIEWQKAFDSGMAKDKQLNKIAVVFHQYEIPYNETVTFLESLLADISTSEYKNYQDLEMYMMSSSSIICIMMARLIGINSGNRYPKDEITWQPLLKAAQILGITFHMTSFLRDIKEDVCIRNKIYLPQTELETYGVTKEMLIVGKVTPEFTDLMKFQIERIRLFYAESEKSLVLVHPSCQRALKIIMRVYEDVINKIEKSNYDVFSKKPKTRIWEKMMLAFKLARPH